MSAIDVAFGALGFLILAPIVVVTWVGTWRFIFGERTCTPPKGGRP